MSVAYSGAGGGVVRYTCTTGRSSYALGSCLSFSSIDLDRRVAEELLEPLRPMAIDAALIAARALDERRATQRQVLADELAQREYEAKLAERRYQSVDSDNRLVAGTLEASWERALAELAAVKVRLESFDGAGPASNTVDRNRLMALAKDLDSVWHAPQADRDLQQRIVSLMLEELVVDVDDRHREIVVVLHWRGGQHSELRVPKRGKGKSNRHTSANIVDLVRSAATRWTDEDLAAFLNSRALTTGMGNPWTRGRVRSLRAQHTIPAYDAEIGEKYVSLSQAARLTGASATFIHGLILRRVLPHIQIGEGARIEILKADLERPDIAHAIENRHLRTPRRRYASDLQETLPLDDGP